MMNPFIDGAALLTMVICMTIPSDNHSFFSALISANGVNNEMFWPPDYRIKTMVGPWDYFDFDLS